MRDVIDIRPGEPFGFLGAEAIGKRPEIIAQVKALYEMHGARPGFVGRHQEVVPWLTVTAADALFALIREDWQDALNIHWYTTWLTAVPEEARQDRTVESYYQGMLAAYKKTEIAGKDAPRVLQGMQVLTAPATYDFLWNLDALTIHFNAVRNIPSEGALFWQAVKEVVEEAGGAAGVGLAKLFEIAKWGLIAYFGFKLIDLTSSKK